MSDHAALVARLTEELQLLDTTTLQKLAQHLAQLLSPLEQKLRQALPVFPLPLCHLVYTYLLFDDLQNKLKLHLSAADSASVLTSKNQQAQAGDKVATWRNLSHVLHPSSHAVQAEVKHQFIFMREESFPFLRSAKGSDFMRGESLHLDSPYYKTFAALFRDIGSDQNCIHPVIDSGYNGICSAPCSNSGKKFIACDGHGRIGQGQKDIANQWVVGVAVYHEGGADVYQNGQRVGQDFDKSNHPRSSDPFLLSTRLDGHGRCFVGDIAEVRVYDKALNEQEVAWISNQMQQAMEKQ
eukprot:gb/GEZN01011598.1/.p1 GENE.gb/GEZN01011598.1/~~gb/GEZN01011598.1/.p1  ORF type:complete len:296 (-),score=58.50 gb/GEZN01011598.1/:230-1117(-)